MLKEQNERLTRVGPGTPGGNMLRRYWWPVGFTQEQQVGGIPTKVRLLGEDLVLFRDGQGRLGLLGLHCSHRGTSLEFGRVEEQGIRCCYHGWLYDHQGACIEQPAEPDGSTFHERVVHPAYLAQEIGGLIFGYLGPTPAPLLPNYDLLARQDGNRKLSASIDYCNWLQRAENSVDQGHLPFLHASGYPEIAFKRPEIGWERTWYGVRALTHVEGIDTDKVSIYIFPSHNRFAGNRVYGEPAQHMNFRVPVDDTETITYALTFNTTEDGRPGTITTKSLIRGTPGVYTPVDNGYWRVVEEDRMAAEQQGPIANRSVEHLGSSDRAVIMMREMVEESIAAVEDDADPIGVIRDPERNTLIAFDATMAGVTAVG